MKQSIAEEFLTNEARRRIDKGEPFPDDPYINKWIDISISAICQSSDLDDSSNIRLVTVYEIASA